MRKITNQGVWPQRAFLLVAAAALAAVPVFAQAPAVTALVIERVVQLSNVSTVAPPTLPASTVAALTAGTLEVRERLIYNAAVGTLTSTIFSVAPGSQIPTPLSTDVTQQTLAQFAITVDRVYIGTKPAPSIQFVGSVSTSVVTPFGNPFGAPATVSLGYTTDTPAKISQVVHTVAGVASIYSPSAAGLVVVTQPPAPPGGGGTGGTSNPTVVIAQPTFTTTIRQARLDASGSTDPNGLALTYAWTSGSPSATIINPAIPTPDVQFDSGFGVYTFTVTVTNSKGMSSTGTVTVQYLGR